MRRIARRMLCVAGLVSACAGPAVPPAPITADALSDVRALIGDASCNSDAQCHSLPLGARPCGGPDLYVAWSTARTDERALATAAERHAAERRAANAAGRVASICSVLADPGASCRPVAVEGGVARRCALGRSD